MPPAAVRAGTVVRKRPVVRLAPGCASRLPADHGGGVERVTTSVCPCSSRSSQDIAGVTPGGGTLRLLRLIRVLRLIRGTGMHRIGHEAWIRHETAAKAADVRVATPRLGVVAPWPRERETRQLCHHPSCPPAGHRSNREPTIGPSRWHKCPAHLLTRSSMSARPGPFRSVRHLELCVGPLFIPVRNPGRSFAPVAPSVAPSVIGVGRLLPRCKTRARMCSWLSRPHPAGRPDAGHDGPSAGGAR
jgi:hypothetical protein